ncbi:hypothetical protein [Xylanimonas ulmi]|uniref:Uncharacterized protein n=1 Tax=Xylanimonas ulmi TaxID=228973 RepID=A0A4Q7M6I3_9MICO|nr:hypothetical protein [Xylanibacterium ulmi]RZS62218.1 hypothetical protein EV386_2539 [Xylanibacterium ulmi]
MTRPKSVTFWRLWVLSQAQRRPPGDTNWTARLEAIAAHTLDERTVDGKIYDPRVSDGKALLGIHAPLKPDFMTTIDLKTKTVSDLMSDDDDSAPFANSTAAMFLPPGNVVAVITGNQSSPKAQSVEKFLEELVPLPTGDRWKIEPLMDHGQLVKLQKEAQGAVAFSSRFSTAVDLLSPESEAPEGMVSFADRIASRVGGDIEVTIEIKLTPESRNRSTSKRMLDLIKGDVPRLVRDRGSKTKATAVLPGGVEEELELVAHRLAATVDIDETASESRRFSALLDYLTRVGGEMEGKVRELLEG